MCVCVCVLGGGGGGGQSRMVMTGVKSVIRKTPRGGDKSGPQIIIIIIMYIYHALINALSAHVIHINLNMIFYTHVEHSPTKIIYIIILKKQRKRKKSKLFSI